MGFDAMRPFLDDHTKNMLNFHDSYDSLHKVVDKEILPEELGGTNGKFNNKHCSTAVHQIIDHLKDVKKYAKIN